MAKKTTGDDAERAAYALHRVRVNPEIAGAARTRVVMGELTFESGVVATLTHTEWETVKDAVDAQGRKWLVKA